MIKFANNLANLVTSGEGIADRAALGVGSAARKVVTHEPTLADKNYDLKRSLLGPTIVNPHRAKEYADSVLLQLGWAVPGAVLGSTLGPAGVAMGISAGAGVGKAHAIAKEFARLSKAKDILTKPQAEAADKMLKGTVYGGLGGALLGATAGLGISDYTAGEGTTGYRDLAFALAGAGWGGLTGGLLGRHLSRQSLLNNRRLGKIVRKYN